MFIAFLVSSAVTYTVLYMNCVSRANELLRYDSLSAVYDLNSTINSSVFSNNGNTLIRTMYEEGEESVKESLKNTNYTYLARTDGTIYFSGNEKFIGKNIRDIQYISGILDDVTEKTINAAEPVTTFQMTPTSVKTLDGEIDVHYMLIMDSGFPDVVFLEAFLPEYLETDARFLSGEVTANRNIGLTGISVAINPDLTVATYMSVEGVYGNQFEYPELIERYEEGTVEGIVTTETQYDYYGETVENVSKIMYFRGVYWGEDSFGCLNKSLGIYFLSLYPAEEALEQANDTIFLIVLIEVVVFTVLFIVLRLLIKRRVIRKLGSVNASLDKITAGDLEEKVEVRDTYEFDTLSTDINATVDRLKEYIAEAAARIDADLAVAKAIQSSALPNVFPPFPERKEFELFASMNAAKEVGGDFYDFYMLNDHTLGFLIADVSGKSIPGAMFMMTSKTVIKSLAESGLPPAEVFSIANEKLCEGNEAEMFVTAWLGYLDLKTGLVRVANAGHNPPILIREGKAEYVIMKPGLMLAGMDGVRYKELTLQLEKGDMLYLYTDGVTEAMNKDEEQYGEDRLQKLLSFGEEYPAPSAANGIAETVCDMVTADVTKFTNGAEQSDDITMLCVRFLGGE